MALHNSLHTGSAARPVLSAQDARLALAGLLALNGPGPLDVRPGIMYAPGNPGLVTGDTSTGPWRYTVAPGSFVTTKGNLDGPHLSTNDGNTLVPTIVPPGSNSRYDVIYAMQLDADATISPDGSTAPLLGVVNGAAAASPSIPAAPAGAVVLATALILSTAIGGTSGVGVTLNTLVSRFTTTRNDPIPVRNATERAEVTPYDGLQVYRLDTHVVEAYNGTAWGNPTSAIGVQATKNAAQAVTGLVNTVVLFPAEDWDSSAFHDLVTNNSRITIPAGLGGKYLVGGKVGFTSGTLPGGSTLSVYVNGNPSTIVARAVLSDSGALSGSVILLLAAGNFIELVINIATTSSLQSNLVDYTPCYFSAVLLGI